MPVRIPTEIISVPDAGVTTLLPSTVPVQRYIIDLTQTGTMAGNTSVSSDGTDSGDEIYEVEFPGGMTLGAQTCTIFGITLTTAQALNRCLIVARWDGAAFQSQLYSDFNTSNVVEAKHILADAVTTVKILNANVTLAKMAGVTRGSMIVGDATGRPALVSFKAVGEFPLGDGTDTLAKTLSGDATIAGTGAITIAANAITTAKINNAAVTWAKLQALSRGSVLRGSAANIVEALSLSGAGAGAFAMTDGVDVLAQLLSGDATADGAGVVTISAGLNTYIAKVTIPTASVLGANVTPISLVGAPGAGKYIRPIACINTLTYNSVAYATNGQVNLRHETATDPCMIAGSSFLFGSVTHTSVMTENAINAVTDTQYIVNKQLLWEVGTGDPTLGNSDIICYLIYQIVDV